MEGRCHGHHQNRWRERLVQSGEVMSVVGVHDGRFWLPETPDQVVGGLLTIEPGQSPTLELVGQLTSGLRRVRSTRDGGFAVDEYTLIDQEPALTVHGDLFDLNQRVSLLRALTRNRSDRWGGRVADPGRQQLMAAFAVVGDHVSGPEHEFTGIRLRLEGLDEWAALGAFSRATENRGGEIALCHRFDQVVPATACDGSVVDFDWTFNVTGTDSESATMSRRVFLEIRNLPLASWVQLDRRVVTPLVTLLTLCTGRRARILELRARTKGGDWIDIVGRWLETPSSAARLRRHDMLVPRGVIELKHVARWIDRVDALGPLPPVVAASVSTSSHSLETELLQLTTVAEGLHRRIYNDDNTELYADEVAQAREAACNATARLGDHVRDAIDRALTHFGELSYPRRVQQLGERAEQFAPGVTGATNRWKSAVVNSRNLFAHLPGDLGFIGEGNVDQHLAILASLRWTLRVILLGETGLKPETIRARIAEHEPYRYFLDRVRHQAPKIYPTDAMDSGNP